MWNWETSAAQLGRSHDDSSPIGVRGRRRQKGGKSAADGRRLHICEAAGHGMEALAVPRHLHQGPLRGQTQRRDDVHAQMGARRDAADAQAPRNRAVLRAGGLVLRPRRHLPCRRICVAQTRLVPRDSLGRGLRVRRRVSQA